MHILAAFCVVLTHLANADDKLYFYSEVTAPYYILDDAGNASGLNVDIAKALLEKLNQNVVIEHRPWARAIDAALHQPNVILVSTPRTEKRESQLQWLGLLHRVRASLVGLKGKFPEALNNLELAKKYRVATVRGYGSANYLLEKGFTEHRNLVLVPSTTQQWTLLFNNRVDMVLANMTTDRYEMESIGFSFDELDEVLPLTELALDLHIAASLKTSETTLMQLENAITEMKANGRFNEILSHWGIQ